MPGDDGVGETKTWDRASIAFRSRKPYVPEVSADDLLLPNEAGKFRTLGMCLVCAFGLTILYVAFPLFVVGIFVPLGPWYPASVGGTLVGLTILLLIVSSHETRQFRKLAKERQG